MNNPETNPKPETEIQLEAGGDCPSAPCSQYISFMDIPPEVHAAAETLFSYFERQGMREWEFSHVADRRLVGKLERERDSARRCAEITHRHLVELRPKGSPVPPALPWIHSANV